MLADVQPYSLTQAVIDAATSSGKTVILVDPYKTSRVEFETGYVHEAKISLSVRGWPSPVDGRWVDRDVNAARNILSWGKSPSLHRRHIETGCDPLELVTVH
jgi:putative transposase